jgi:hypothetical protein
MAQAGTSKRRASLPSSDSANVLSNVDRKHPLKPPRIAWVKHGKYIALGGAGTAYLEIVERIKWSLASENWVRWVARAGVTLHGLTVVSAPPMVQLDAITFGTQRVHDTGETESRDLGKG